MSQRHLSFKLIIHALLIIAGLYFIAFGFSQLLPYINLFLQESIGPYFNLFNPFLSFVFALIGVMLIKRPIVKLPFILMACVLTFVAIVFLNGEACNIELSHNTITYWGTVILATGTIALLFKWLVQNENKLIDLIIIGVSFLLVTITIDKSFLVLLQMLKNYFSL